MILHLHVFPSQKVFTIKVEDPSSMTLKTIFQAYQSELDLDLPCCFFSQPEQMLLDPTLTLDQNWIACEDHLIVFSLLNRPF